MLKIILGLFFCYSIAVNAGIFDGFETGSEGVGGDGDLGYKNPVYRLDGSLISVSGRSNGFILVPSIARVEEKSISFSYFGALEQFTFSNEPIFLVELRGEQYQRRIIYDLTVVYSKLMNPHFYEAIILYVPMNKRHTLRNLPDIMLLRTPSEEVPIGVIY